MSFFDLTGAFYALVYCIFFKREHMITVSLQLYIQEQRN